MHLHLLTCYIDVYVVCMRFQEEAVTKANLQALAARRKVLKTHIAQLEKRVAELEKTLGKREGADAEERLVGAWRGL